MTIIWLSVALNLRRQGLAFGNAIGLALLGVPLDAVMVAAILI